ncbi:MAG: SDR family oxidoreductase [Acidobacteriota bacterium]|nr:SDR family oxidoreductase [Acidobacteriota bacterium]
MISRKFQTTGATRMGSAETRGKLEPVLVTGATDGLGRATAIALSRRGYRVFAGGRSAERRAALETLAREQKLALEPLEMDVTSDGSVDAAVGEIERRAGAVAALVNNAGIGIGAAMEEISLADMRRQFETNLIGVLRVTQRVLPEMRKRRRGRIVNMSSVAGKLAGPIMGPYCASKHALEAMSDAMRLELYPFGVQVIVIEPGYISTSIGRNSMELSAGYANAAPESAYAPIYEAFRVSFANSMKNSRTTPEDCAATIVRAMEAERPRARYAVTPEAKMALWMRRLLPDRIFDKMIRKSMGLEEFRAEIRNASGTYRT